MSGILTMLRRISDIVLGVRPRDPDIEALIAAEIARRRRGR